MMFKKEGKFYCAYTLSGEILGKYPELDHEFQLTFYDWQNDMRLKSRTGKRHIDVLRDKEFLRYLELTPGVTPQEAEDFNYRTQVDPRRIIKLRR